MSEPLVDMPFAGHLDESVRDELNDPLMVFAEAQNIRLEERGGAARRLGFAALSLTKTDSSSRVGGDRIFADKKTTYIIGDTDQLDSYDSISGASVEVGRVCPAAVTKYIDLPAMQGANALGAPADIAYANGYLCAVWAINSGLVVALVNASTGAVVMQPYVLVASGSPKGRIASYGNIFIIVALLPGDATVTAKYLDVSSQATITAHWQNIGANVGTDHATTTDAQHAFAIHGLTDRVVFAYIDNGTEIKLKTLTTAGVQVTATVAMGVGATPGLIALGGVQTDRVWLAWYEPATQIFVQSFHSTLLTTIGGPELAFSTDDTVNSIGLTHSETAGAAVVCASDTSDDLFIGYLSSTGATINIVNNAEIRNVQPLGPPFVIGTRFYMPMSPVGIDRTQFVVTIAEFTDSNGFAVPVANLQPYLAAANANPFVKAVAGPSGTTRFFPFGVIRTNTSAASLVAEISFSTRAKNIPAPHCGSVYLAGGVPTVVETQRVAELGFLHAPDRPTIDVATSGSVSYAVGARYVVVFFDRDDRGNLVASGVSLPSNSTGVIVSKEVKIETRQLTMGRRSSSYFAVVYATEDGGQAPYHRIGTMTKVAGNKLLRYIDNSGLPSSGALLFGTGALPGTGAQQDRRTIGATPYLVSYNGMLVGGSGPDLFWSGQYVRGEQPWFNPVFQVPVSDDGDLVAWPVMDGTMFPMSRSGVYAIAGEPPADNGTLGGMGTPRRLAADVGCIDPNTIVVTSLGIFFQSDRGIELLTRNQALEDFSKMGAKVQVTLTAFPVCTSAVLDTRNNLVRFTLTTAESAGRVSGEGVTLIFDLSMGEWISKDVYSSNEAAQNASMCFVSGSFRYCWLGVDGEVHYERDANDPSAHLDGSAWPVRRVVTSWFKVGGLQGEQKIDRVLLLTSHFTNHNLTIASAYDYITTYPNPKTWTAAQLAALSKKWPDAETNNQRGGTSIRVKVEDAAPSSGEVGSGRGSVWTVLTLEGERRSGARRTFTGQRGSA